jgi:hypothetical protein
VRAQRSKKQSSFISKQMNKNTTFQRQKLNLIVDPRSVDAPKYAI